MGYRGEQKQIHWISCEKLCLPKSEGGGMRFRELSRFNDFLLAKQVRSLKNNEDSLFHRVFKAKFFPNCSILEASSLSKGPYAWKSIAQARRVIDLGSVWCVGDGKSIKVKGDKWLPSLDSSCIVSLLSSLNSKSNVGALIDEESHTWNLDLIKSEFLAHEAEIISGIPLSLHNTPDKQVWLPSNQGVFTTRSVYKLLASADRLSLPNCSDSERRSQMWKGIWSLQVPHKIKHLMWKVANEAIFTLYNLWRWQMVQSVYCPGCNSTCEDTIHALWGCPALMIVLEAASFWKNLLKYKFSKSADLLELVFTY